MDLSGGCANHLVGLAFGDDMKRIRYSAILLSLLTLMLAGCGVTGGEPIPEFTYDFEEGEQGWVAGFADLPADYDQEFYQLESSWGELPSGLEGHGISMQGHNYSDDLFMFLKVQLDGLKPDTTYDADFALDLATNIPEGMMGIGGSPGESVYVKAGATTTEPLVVEDASNWLRMNIDKGNQAEEGQDMINLGNIANPNLGAEVTGEAYAIKTLNSEGRAFQVTSDGDGKLWLIVGTDSGFEGPTTVYYDRISVELAETGDE
jgi:hypothetical protein